MQLRALTQKPVPVVPLASVALVAAAWISLIALGQSPYGHFMGHETGHGPSVTPASAQDSGALMLVFFTAGWALMIVAMMLPAALPLVMRLSRSLVQSGEGARSMFLLVAGYVLAWTAFGVCAHLALQACLQAAGLSSGAGHMIAPAALVLAGAYQFSPLKHRAVHRLWTPPVERRANESGWRPARILALGAREGATCIGCCWALMLLMLAGAAGGSDGMLALGLVMFLERNAPWGNRLVMPLGLFLVGLGLMLGWGSLLGVFPWHGHSM